MNPLPVASRSLNQARSRRSLLGSVVAASALGGVLRYVPPAAAQSDGATPATGSGAPSHRFGVGQIEVVILNDGVFPGPASFFAVNAPPAELNEVVTAQGLDPQALLLGVHPMLIETGGQRVLVDTGIGAFEPGGSLLESLAAEGIAPEEIDIVLITHMHTDHFGGAINADGGLTFPNAQHLINAAEFDFWASEPSLGELIVPDEFKAQFRQGAADGLAALGGDGALEQIAPGDEIAPGVTVLDAKGHTPGQLAVEVASDGDVLLQIVDVAHVPEIQLAHPDWFMVADNWPAWAVTTRQMMFDRAAAEKLLVATYHFPFPGLGRVTKDEIGWIWTAEG